MAWSLNGFGTTFYGQRDYRNDGSYITTEWITALYIPLIPLRSLRVRYQGLGKEEPGEGSFPIGFGSTDSYAVYQKTRPNWRQVLCTYALILLPVGGLILVFSLGESYFSQGPDHDNVALLVLAVAVIVPAFFPHYLRYRARKKAGV